MTKNQSISSPPFVNQSNGLSVQKRFIVLSQSKWRYLSSYDSTQMITTTMTWEESIMLTNYETIIVLIIGCDCPSGGGPSSSGLLEYY